MSQTGSTQQALDGEWDRGQVSVQIGARQVVLASYESSAISPLEYAEKIVALSKSPAEVSRRLATRRRVDILRDAWGPLLKASLANWLTPPVLYAVLGRLLDHIDRSRNPAKNIWRECSVVYNEPARRSTPKDESDGNRYKELLDGTGFDLFWPEVELLTNACNEVFVWPDVVSEDGKKKIEHRYATGDTLTVVTAERDATKIEAIFLIDEYSDIDQKEFISYRLWTKYWYARFAPDSDRGDGKLKRIGYVSPHLAPEDPDPSKDLSYTNPYEEIPLILIRKNRWQDCVLDITTDEDLVDLTLRGGEDRAFYRYMQKMSGFKQAAIVGQSIEKKSQQLLDPGACLEFETDGSLTIIDWQLDLKQRLDCADRDEVAAAAARGINPERYKKTANYQTGFSARIADAGLASWRTKMSMILSEAEQRYKRMFCIVAKAHGIENPPNPDILLMVEHAPMSYPSDPDKQLDVEAKEVSLGLESPVTLMQRRHPEWSEDECRKAISARMADTAAVNDMKVSRNIPDDLTKESRGAVENGRMGPVIRDQKPSSDRPGPATPTGERSRATRVD